MGAFVIFGAICILISVYFWYQEIIYYTDNMLILKNPHKWKFVRFFQKINIFFKNFQRLFTDGRWFLIDISATMFMVSALGMGTGITGGVLGLFLGNAVSVLLYFVRKRMDKKKLAGVL